MSTHPKDTLNRTFDSLIAALNDEALARLVELRADGDAQARIEYLADRCTDGLLTDDEREEYEEMMSFANVLAILQARARRRLRTS